MWQLRDLARGFILHSLIAVPIHILIWLAFGIGILVGVDKVSDGWGLVFMICVLVTTLPSTVVFTDLLKFWLRHHFHQGD